MTSKRTEKLMPNGTPKWIRIYDNEGRSCDRYTVVFSGSYNNIGKKAREQKNNYHPYVGMSESPFHPQGFCQHGEEPYLIDAMNGKWPPSIGKKNHLGTRIAFSDLPQDCKKVVLNDYKELWGIKD